LLEIEIRASGSLIGLREMRLMSCHWASLNEDIVPSLDVITATAKMPFFDIESSLVSITCNSLANDVPIGQQSI
jgi:hypothetical protein